MAVKPDNEIAREADKRPIQEIGATLGIPPEQDRAAADRSRGTRLPLRTCARVDAMGTQMSQGPSGTRATNEFKFLH